MKKNSGLYNKHRPNDWSQVIGNEASVSSFKNTLHKEGGLTSYIIEGASGCGKTTIARIATKELECDVLHITEIDCVTDGTIDMVRSLARKVTSNSGGKNRAWIFDEAHRITEKAQESLLKLLEDARETDYFFLCTTDASGFNDTLKSRCQKVTINKLTDNDIDKVLENVIDKEDLDIDEDVIDIIIETADGSARNALVMLESVMDLSADDAKDKLKSDVYVASEQTVELKEFMRSLIKPNTTFNQSLDLLKKIDRKKESPEGIRLATINYANAVRMQGRSIERIDSILDQLMYDYQGIYQKGQAWAFIIDKIYKIHQ